MEIFLALKYKIVSNRDMLDDCKENILLPVLGGDQLEFEISGLEIMNDDPSDVDVLYGKVKDTSGKLQQIVDSIGNSNLINEV